MARTKTIEVDWLPGDTVEMGPPTAPVVGVVRAINVAEERQYQVGFWDDDKNYRLIWMSPFELRPSEKSNPVNR